MSGRDKPLVLGVRRIAFKGSSNDSSELRLDASHWTGGWPTLLDSVDGPVLLVE